MTSEARAPFARSVRQGKLIAIVGPSGAGKDTLIDAARNKFQGDGRLLFPRRIITRPSSAAEDNDTVSETEFKRRKATGGFSLSWQAHGLCYALPHSVLAAVEQGRYALCNLSRSSLEEARLQFPGVAVVLVTASAELVAKRLAARGRESAEVIRERLTRKIDREDALHPDLIITNNGPVEAAVERLIAYLLAELNELGPVEALS